MAILYLISAAALWAGILLCRKSERKQNLAVWCVCAAMLDLCVQALCAGIIAKLGLPVSCASIGIANLAACAGLGIWIAKKGKQEYEIRALDIISVLVLLGLTLFFGIAKYGKALNEPAFISVDASAHCRFAKTVALEHTFPTNRFFSSLTGGLLMEVQQALTGCADFDLYRAFILCEVLYTSLAALLFWALLRERCGEGKWQRFVPLLVTPFYWVGYPLYTTLFGFSYLGAAVSLVNLELILLDQLCRKRTDRIISVLGLNLVLFGVFVSYTLFVPVAFFGAFISIALLMWQEAGGEIRKMVSVKNVCLMLAVFLVPSVLGLLHSFGDIGSASPGGDIAMEGACYNDMYSSFILPLPFMIMGLYFLVRKKEGRFLLPVLGVLLLMMGLMLLGLAKHKVSVYYYVRNNNLLWLAVWVLVTEAVWGMMERTKWAVLMPLFFYSVLFMGKYVDPWLKKVKPITTRVQVWSYVDLILINNTYFNFDSYVSADMLDLYRYAEKNLDLNETKSINTEICNGWYKTLTGGTDTYSSANYTRMLQELENDHPRYILAGYGRTYDVCRPYLDTLEVAWENGAGKVLILPEDARPTVDAPPEPQAEEGST